MSERQDRTTPRRGRRTADAPAGRDALLRAATRCFADHGFEAAGVRMIASRAKAAPNLVTVHFGGKDGLWLACVDLLADTLDLRIKALEALANDGKTPVRERLQLAIAMTAAYYDQHPDLRGFIARAALEPAPRGQIVAERLLKPLYEAARPLIEQGISAGAIPFADPALVFVLLNSALGQPDRIAPVLAILAPERRAENLPIHIGKALSGLLADEDSRS